MDINEATPGVFCWIDLSSPDLDGSTRFYGAVFGWEFGEQHDADGNRIYVMATRHGRSVLGMGPQQPQMAGMPPVWMSYVATDDLAKTTELVDANGGSVMLPPMDVGDAGSMAIYAAPDGAMVNAWQPGHHIGAEVANEDCTWGWSELMTRDVDAARSFYSGVFGWSYDEMDMGPAGTYHVGRVGEHQMCGLMTLPEDVPPDVPNHWGVYLYVDDIDATIERVLANGGAVTVDPIDIPDVGRSAMIRDPQGGTFGLLQPLRT